MNRETKGAGNPLREAWLTGRGTAGGWCEIPSTLSAEIVARAGFEWICVDWQHAPLHTESVAAMVHVISAAGTVPLVRVPSNEGWLIQNALDVGAFGVIVPLVNNRAEAERAAAACRYPPAGSRSYSPIRIADVVGSEPDVSNEQVVCIVMIETQEGLENIEEITTVVGVDGLFIGPDDLTLSLGLPLGAKELDGPIRRVLECGQRNDVPVGRHCGSGEAARQALDSGFLYAAVSSDRYMLFDAARREAVAAGFSETTAGAGRPERLCQLVLE